MESQHLAYPEMRKLNLPLSPVTIKEENGKASLFDVFRKRYVLLSQEEWVRQQFLHWLVNVMGYPRGLIAVEKTLKYFRLTKRADAMVYGSSGKPLMMIECKAPSVKISQDAFDQIARYNFSFGVQYLAVTNGLEHYCCMMKPSSQEWHFLDAFPTFDKLSHKA